MSLQSWSVSEGHPAEVSKPPAEVSKPKKEKESMEALEKSFLLLLHSQMPNFCLAGRDESPMDTKQERTLEGDFRKRGETLRQGRSSGTVTTQVSSLHGLLRGTFEKV